MWFICEYARELWRQENDSNPSEALERRWMLFYAVGESIRVAYSHSQKDLKVALRKAADPAWHTSPEEGPLKSVVRRPHSAECSRYKSPQLGL